MLYMVRHGERCDNSADAEERLRAKANPMDPPLTQLGISQAAILGQSQRDYLQKHNYKKIVIESSPFLRCLQTAAAFAKELGITYITTSYRASEFLGDHIYDKQPFDHLEITRHTAEEISEKWLQGVTLVINNEFEEEIRKCYPEER